MSVIGKKLWNSCELGDNGWQESLTLALYHRASRGAVNLSCYMLKVLLYQDYLYSNQALRPIQATQIASEPFWTRQKKLEAFRTSNKNFATWKLFSIEGAPQFTEPLKRLCVRMQILYIVFFSWWNTHFMWIIKP